MVMMYPGTDNITYSNTIWPQWVYYTNTANSTATASDIWPNWTLEAYSSTAVTTIDLGIVWGTWTGSLTFGWPEPRQPARDEEWEAHQRALAEVARERKAEREAAVARAEELLKENLDAQQREDYEAMQAFLVKAASGSTYRIHKGLAGNIDLLSEDGEVLGKYCIHISSEFPVPDNLLAQKLWLEHDEQEFRRIGNYTRAR